MDNLILGKGTAAKLMFVGKNYFSKKFFMTDPLIFIFNVFESLAFKVVVIKKLLREIQAVV